MSKAESEPFLEAAVGSESAASTSPTDTKSCLQAFPGQALKCAILLVYTVLIGFLSVQGYRMSQQQVRAAPEGFQLNTNEQLQKFFIPSEESKYAGPPDSQTNAAWKDLLSLQMLRLSEPELSQSGISTIPLQDSPGYIATTQLWHDLHCLFYLRATIYMDYFHPNVSAETRVIHSDHCLHILQQSIMCQGDTSLIGLYWNEGEELPRASPSTLQHQCIDWEKMEDGLRKRAIPTEEVLNLKNPIG